MDKRKFVVDEIIDNIVVLEDMDTKEIVQEDLNNINLELHEGAILYLEDCKYSLNLDEETRRRESLRERLERLKGKNSE